MIHADSLHALMNIVKRQRSEIEELLKERAALIEERNSLREELAAHEPGYPE